MPATIQDFVLVNAGLAGQFVQLKNNLTGALFTSTAPSLSNGSFTIVGGAPPGYYTLSVSPSLIVPTWVVYDSFFWVGPDVGDTLVIGKTQTSLGPKVDITHPTYGAKGDLRRFFDATMTLGAPTTLTSATAAFTALDVGKWVNVNGAIPPSTNGAVLLAKVVAFNSVTSVTLDTPCTVAVAGVAAKIFTGNAVAIQKAINQVLTFGGRLYVPLDSFGGQYGVETQLGPYPGSVLGGFTNATRPLYIEGDGMEASFLVAGSVNTFTGLLGYYNANVARVVASDICFDGDYVGAGGTLPQPSGSGSGLISLPYPYTNAFGASVADTGIHHQFTRCRFYRPAAFGFQPTAGCEIDHCEYDHMGQPDLASGATHWDNNGSGTGWAKITYCSWHDGSGNYADFVDGTGGAGRSLKLIFIGNTSTNHQIGGIYACGIESVITGNNLHNNVAGSGIGYDAGTVASMRSKNLVGLNVLDNIATNLSGLSSSLYGDIILPNTSSDTPAGMQAFLQGGVIQGMATQTIAYAASVTPDISKGQVVIFGTLTGNITVNNPTNLLPGQIVIYQFTQDATGNRLAFFGSAHKGQPGPVLDPNSTSYIMFISDGGNLWNMTVSAIDQNGKGSTIGAVEGIQLGGNVRSLGAPVISADGASIYIQAAAASIFLRPHGYGSNQNMVVLSDSAGTFVTNDSSGTTRNILDDGAGRMVPKNIIELGAVAGSEPSTGGSETSGDKIILSHNSRPRGFGVVAGNPGVLVIFVANLASEKVSFRVNGSAPISGGTEFAGIITSGQIYGGGQVSPGNFGTIQTANGLWQGSGAPSNSNGANGDYYYRTDTPGTANQRIYVKSAGTWSGIL